MDFTTFKAIGLHIDAKDEQIEYGAGYDHNWVLEKPAGILGLAATACEPVSGRLMEVYTTQPGVQLYTANWVNNENGKFGKKYNSREAFCLETQHFADAVNQSQFPSTILKPDEMYMHACIYKFSVKK
jgi:aldose 1-epimerase